MKASDSGVIDAAELKDAQATMSPELYNQEYECSFDAAIVGAFYGREIAALEAEKRIMAEWISYVGSAGPRRDIRRIY